MSLYKKTSKTVILSILMVLSANIATYAEEVNEPDEIQEKTELDKNYRGLGVTAGYLSAIGLSYREFFADRFGFKATGIVLFDQSQTFGSLGLQGMYVIGENEWMRFYGLAGVSNFTTKRASYNYSYPTSTQSYDSSNQEYVNIPPKGYSNYEMYNSVGAGIGIEFGRSRQGLSLAVELPWILSFKNTTLNSFYPIPSLSVMYNF